MGFYKILPGNPNTEFMAGCVAEKQVASLQEGLMYQGLFFLLQATPILKAETHIKQVCLEHDQAAGVDDVAVFYREPGVDAGGRHSIADYYQVKYHVDQRGTYGADNFCDPTFFGRTRSLLQQFYEAHKKLKDQKGWYRLYLISNWAWDSTDPLGPYLREGEECAIPEQFFTAGSRSKLGKVRVSWQTHLGIDDDEFKDFACRLRLSTNHLGRRGLRESLDHCLARFGLKCIPIDMAQNPYDSLIQQFVVNGTNEFDAQGFRAMCEREKLFDAPPKSGPPVLGVRSFLRATERMEDECNGFVCVARCFEGRYIREASLWQESIRPEVQAFFTQTSLRTKEHHILLDCHLSIAFLVGYELDRKSGAKAFPFQKGVNPGVWKPSGEVIQAATSGHWVYAEEPSHHEGKDVAFSISASRDAANDVRSFIQTLPSIGKLGLASTRQGVGVGSVKGPDHAVALADELADLIRAHRPADGGTLHLFLAVPNALAFFLGQHRGAFGKVQLYEFDFEGARGGSYSPSISFQPS